MHVQLPHQVDSMRLDGFDAQAQVRRYLLCRLPLRDALDDLAFTRGQRVRRQGRAGRALPQDACGGAVEPRRRWIVGRRTVTSVFLRRKASAPLSSAARR